MDEKNVRTPLQDIRKLMDTMPQYDLEAVRGVRARDATLTKPAGSLGQIEMIVEWLAGWQGDPKPVVSRPLVAIFAANHGVVQRGVSAFPQYVTKAMVENFAAGGAAINQICRSYDLGLKVFDLALDMPTPDVSRTDAFDQVECAATIAFGMEAIASEPDLLCIGEMGIGNTTIASIIFHALYGGDVTDWVGRGSGADEEILDNKYAVVAQAVNRIKEQGDDRRLSGLEILQRVGGREIAAMCGVILAARHQRIPVVIDGFVASSAAALLHAECEQTLDHCLFAHRSAEKAHDAVLKRLRKKPLLDLGMRLGEGSGAAFAAGIIKTAAMIHGQMATFEQAKI